MSEIWELAKKELKKKIDSHSFRMWIEKIEAEELSEKIILFFPNEFSLKRVRGNGLEEKIRQAISFFMDKHGDRKETIFEVKSNDKARQMELSEATPSIREIRKPSQLPLSGFSGCNIIPSSAWNPRMNFESLVVGSFNQWPLQALKGYLNQSVIFQPIFLVSNHGLGKTHLASAAANLIREKSPEKKIMFFQGSDFVRAVQAAYKYDALQEFWRKFEEVMGLAVFDGIEEIAGRKKSEEIFCGSVEKMIGAGIPVIFTSWIFPVELKAGEKFLSLARGSMIVPISHPDFSDRMKILDQASEKLMIRLEPNVTNYLAGEITGDIRPLLGVIATLAEIAKSNGNAVSLELAHSVIGLYRQKKTPTQEQITEAVAGVFGVKAKNLSKKDRSEPLVSTRQIAMYLCRELLRIPLVPIGQFFNLKHATVIHAVRKAPQKIFTLGSGMKEALRKELVKAGISEEEISRLI